MIGDGRPVSGKEPNRTTVAETVIRSDEQQFRYAAGIPKPIEGPRSERG
jgi:hypothetical protein